MQNSTNDDLLKLMQINDTLRVKTKNNTSVEKLPYWMMFFVWLGYYLKSTETDKENRSCFILIPDKSYVSLLMALGAEICSAQFFSPKIDGNNIDNIEIGTTLYFYDQEHRQRNGKFKTKEHILKLIEVKSAEEEFAGFKEKVFHLSGDTFQYYATKSRLNTLTITRLPLTSKSKNTLSSNGKIFGSLIDSYDDQWLLSEEAVCVIVGDGKALQENGSSISLASENSQIKPITLVDFLGLEGRVGKNQTKVGLIKPRSETLHEIESALLFLDGPYAFRFYVDCQIQTKANTVISVIENSEYNEDIKEKIARWDSYPTLTTNSNDTIQLPPGVQAAIFSVKTSD